MEYTGPKRHDLKQVQGIAGLHIAGSQDHPEYRQTSFRYIGGAPQYWLVAAGTHDLGATGPYELLRQVIGQFVSAYVLNDASARKSLTLGALQNSVSGLHQFRTKLVDRWWDVHQRDFVAWVREVLPWGKWLHDASVDFHREQKAER